IIPHINGLNSTARIASLAHADPHLVNQALSHLLYYNCLLITDIFQFSAIYAVTAEISLLVTDKDMQQECASYIACSSPALLSSTSPALLSSTSPNDPPQPPHSSIPATRIISLYASLRQGLALKQWCLDHAAFLDGIDVRRFISFGVVKGFLYRVHKYAVKTTDASSTSPGVDVGAGAAAGGKSGVAKPPATPGGAAVGAGAGAGAGTGVGAGAGEDDTRRAAERLPLMAKYLDGTHCLDEICTDLGWSEKDVLKKLSSYGDVQIIHK
ncbi:hypothetical protein FGG08_007641, partial [Glutinoglossum americanum]